MDFLAPMETVEEPTIDPQLQVRVWDRRQGESRKAFNAFLLYRDQPDKRGFTEVAEQLLCTRQNVCKWASKHDWYNRARAWDIHQDQIAQEAQIRERRAMAERIARSGKRLQDVALEQLEKLCDRLANGEPDPNDSETDPAKKRRIYPKLTPYQIARMYEVGVKSERVGRGEPDPDSPNNYAKFVLNITTTPPPVDNPEALAAALALEHELIRE